MLMGELVAVGEKRLLPLDDVEDEELLVLILLVAMVVLELVLFELLRLLALLKERSMMPVTRSLQPAVMSGWSAEVEREELAEEAVVMVRPKLLLLLLESSQ